MSKELSLVMTTMESTMMEAVAPVVSRLDGLAQVSLPIATVSMATASSEVLKNAMMATFFQMMVAVNHAFWKMVGLVMMSQVPVQRL